MKKMWIAIFMVVVVGLLVVAGCHATRSAYESASYQVLRANGRLEVREYPALQVVETPMAAGRRDGGDGSFMRLFRFISGGNAARQKIAMTTPVFMSGGDSNATMAFVLPAKLTADAVPKPTDAAVTVRELPAGRFAVLSLCGGRSAKREAAALDRLRAWMQAEGWKPLSPPVYAYFDPPWTPGFLRRNEVMVRTEGRK